MASLLDKINTLISANLHAMVDKALQSNSVAVMDEYIRQAEDNLDKLEDATATVGGEVKTLKRKAVSQNKSLCSLSDVFSVFSLPQVSYIGENGFVFFLNSSSYSETVKNVTCHIIMPLFMVNGAFEFSVAILVGIEGSNPIFRVQEVRLQYVN